MGVHSPHITKLDKFHFALRDTIRAELERQEANYTIEQVQYSDLAAPIVLCLKEETPYAYMIPLI